MGKYVIGNGCIPCFFVSKSRTPLSANQRKEVASLQKNAVAPKNALGKPSIGRMLNQNKVLILMCMPAIVFFFVFSYLPMPGAYIAFTNFQYNKGIFASPFVGLKKLPVPVHFRAVGAAAEKHGAV